MSQPEPQVGRIPPTQVTNPWRTTVRTVVQATFAALILLPAVVDAAGIGAIPWVAGALGVVGAVTRVLALPAVVAWVARYVPWLSPVHPDDVDTRR